MKKFKGFPKMKNSIIEKLREGLGDNDEFIKSHTKNSNIDDDINFITKKNNKKNSIIERLKQSVSNNDIIEMEIDTTKPRKDNVVLFVPRKLD